MGSCSNVGIPVRLFLTSNLVQCLIFAFVGILFPHFVKLCACEALHNLDYDETAQKRE